MAWQPEVPEGERILVNCCLVARQDVRFDLLVSERHVLYSRAKAIALSDPLETVTVPRERISNVRLKKKNPWPTWVCGGLLLAGALAYAVAFMLGQIDTFHFHILLAVILGGACFVGGRNRWRLDFKAGGKRHCIDQPLASRKSDADAMARALKEAADLLRRG